MSLLLIGVALITAAACLSATAGLAHGKTVMPAVAAIAGGAPSAQIVNYGTDSDTFRRGERATGFITIRNTGRVVIDDVTASVSVRRSLPIVGSVSLGSADYTFRDQGIKPGESKRVEFSVDIPADYMGVSTAGNYDMRVTVKAGGADIGSFSKSVKVT